MANEKTLPTSRRERERHRHRQEILDAAIELLLEKGFEGTTMQEIADRAEFAVGTLYRFFAGKKELYEELVLETWRDVESRLTQALDSSCDELECLRAYNRESVKLTVEYKAMASIFYGHMIRYNMDAFAGLDGELRNIMRRFIDRLEALFRSGIEKGLFAPIEPRILALGYDTLVASYTTIAFGKEEPVDIETWSETIDRIFFEPVLIHKKG